MTKIENHTALKEWAAVDAALAAGDQIVLIRKGGIADARFGVEAERFYILPTYLHQREKQFKPEFQHFFHATNRLDDGGPDVPVNVWCEVAAVFRIDDLDRLLALEPFVIFTSETIRERYAFRPDQAVHVIAVRTWRLSEPKIVANRPEYVGCRSWISVEEEIGLDHSTAAVGEEEFAKRLAAIARVLGQPVVSTRA